MKAVERLDELMWLINTGATPFFALKAVGWTPFGADFAASKYKRPGVQQAIAAEVAIWRREHRPNKEDVK